MTKAEGDDDDDDDDMQVDIDYTTTTTQHLNTPLFHSTLTTDDSFKLNVYEKHRSSSVFHSGEKVS
jgi:hypothetical protein